MTNKTSEIITIQLQNHRQHPTSPAKQQERPLSALRQPFIHWIRAMPMEERFLAVKIYAPEIYQQIRSIFGRQEATSAQRNSQQKSESVVDTKKGQRKIEKIMLDSLVFVSDGHEFLDHICFQYSLLESPERLFDLLINTSENASALTLEEILQHRKNAKNLGFIFEKINNRQKICQQLMEFLRQELFSRFRQHKNIYESIQRNLDQQKRRKKEFSNHWKYLALQTRYKVLLLGHKDINFLSDFLEGQQIIIKTNQLQKDIEDLLKLQKNQFCNRIFKCKFKKIFHPLMSYYELIYRNWKKEVDRIKRKKSLKNNRVERDFSSQNKTQVKQHFKGSNSKKYKKNRKSTSLQSNETNQTEHSTNNIYKSQIQKDAENEDNYFDEFERQYVKQQSRQNERRIDCFEKERDKSKQEKILKYVQSQEELHQIKSQKMKIRHQINDKPEISPGAYKQSQTTQPKVQVGPNNNPQSTSFSQLEVLQITQQIDQTRQFKKKWHMQKVRQVCNCRLEQELQELSDKISQEANQFHDRRIIAFQRIQFLLSYYNIQIKLFGSCANGIAIRNSDIDIAVDSFILNWMEFLPESQRAKAALQKLQELFCTQSWVKELKIIKTAAIPVIKMTLNTQIPFLDPSIGQIYYQLNRVHYSGQINADITIQTINQSHESCHLGIISTNAINQWIEQISSLHSIIIIMKYFFSKNNLNCTYEGGLNTFSMIVLFVAFIYNQKLEGQQNACIVLEKLLRFYVYQFDEKERGIDILKRQQNNIFFLKNNSSTFQGSPKGNKDKADIQIRDPMNQHKNMTRNCYSFFKIKHLFQLILKNCFQKRFQEIDRLLLQRQICQQSMKVSGDMLKVEGEHLAEKNIFCYVMNQIDQFSDINI